MCVVNQNNPRSKASDGELSSTPEKKSCFYAINFFTLYIYIHTKNIYFYIKKIYVYHFLQQKNWHTQQLQNNIYKCIF